jgi:hypothetical protein
MTKMAYYKLLTDEELCKLPEEKLKKLYREARVAGDDDFRHRVWRARNPSYYPVSKEQ